MAKEKLVQDVNENSVISLSQYHSVNGTLLAAFLYGLSHVSKRFFSKVYEFPCQALLPMPQSKVMVIRSAANFKLPVGVNVSVKGSLC